MVVVHSGGVWGGVWWRWCLAWCRRWWCMVILYGSGRDGIWLWWGMVVRVVICGGVWCVVARCGVFWCVSMCGGV